MEVNSHIIRGVSPKNRRKITPSIVVHNINNFDRLRRQMQEHYAEAQKAVDLAQYFNDIAAIVNRVTEVRPNNKGKKIPLIVETIPTIYGEDITINVPSGLFGYTDERGFRIYTNAHNLRTFGANYEGWGLGWTQNSWGSRHIGSYYEGTEQLMRWGYDWVLNGIRPEDQSDWRD